MSSTTLLLAITGGVFCGASLIGMMAILYLWWISNRRARRFEDALQYHQHRGAPASDPWHATMAPSAAPSFYPEVSVPSPAPAPPVGIHSGSIWLDGIGGMVAGQRITIHKSETILGRSGVCDVQFHDPKVSRQHAILRLRGNAYYIEDMQSTGGTFVNGKRVGSTALRDRDQIRIGDSVVVFRQQ
ncbi:MAG: FHA domain-containing protein [Chloroflexi bacterium]|nr:FHA domain-containing protein [Chloroflexota bacterium]